MPTGDGLLVRLRLAGGRIAADKAIALAGLSGRFGNGLVDLGRRGGLQLRGVTADGYPHLLSELAVLGLVDDSAAGEAIRNVVASPLSDLDPQARVDAHALALALEAGLAAAADLRRLPAKFGFAVDDGGAFGLAGVPADIRLVGTGGGVRLTLADATSGATLPTGRAAAAALDCARAFLALCRRSDPPPHRMAGLLAEHGAAAVFAAAGLTADNGPAPAARGPALVALIGARPGFFGLAAPFGRLTADELRRVAAAAAVDLRLTPWRALLIPGAAADDLEAATAGLIVDAADPRLAVVACPGAPHCAAASVPTRAIAARLATLRPAGADGVWLHVSGCAKGCASSEVHAVTLVGRDGAYDLVGDGRADGKALRQHLAAAEAEDLIRRESIR